jgi:hypothetical protein
MESRYRRRKVQERSRKQEALLMYTDKEDEVVNVRWIVRGSTRQRIRTKNWRS